MPRLNHHQLLSHEITIRTALYSYPPIIRARKCLENRANMEDDRVGILETQLAQAKHIAEEADKKYEEVRHS